MSDDPRESLLDRARRNAAKMGVDLPDEPPPTITHDDDLIPDLEYQPTAENQELDRLLANVDIIDAYRRWCGKMEPKVGRRRESIKVSCPNPAHRDANPSAWINLDKQVYNCRPCGDLGGDAYTIAAYHFGYPVPGYQDREHFPKLRRDMARDLGYEVTITPAGREIATEAELVEEEEPPATAEIIEFPAPPDPMGDPQSLHIDWAEMIPRDSFLWRYLNITTKTDLPEQYHFWCGLMALAAATGDDVVLEGDPDVKPNLYVCLYGPSGIGKSRALRMLIELLQAALPYDHDDPISTGIRIAPEPGSGEALIDLFSKIEIDPTDPKTVMGYRQVRGLITFPELADLTAKGSRTGSTMKSKVIELYDGAPEIATSSRATGIIRAHRPYCLMASTTQPKAIRDLLSQTDADSGFVNRWVFAGGALKPLQSYSRKEYDPEPLVRPLQTIRSWASHGRRMVIDGDAFAAWDDFFRAEIEPVRTDSNANPLLIRGDLTLKKLMLLFAANDMERHLTVEHVQMATSLWPYLRTTYQLLSSEIGVGEVDACAEDILRIVAVHATPTPIGEIRRRLGRRHRREVVERALKLLVALSEVNEVAQPGPKRGGRPTVRYELTHDSGGGRYST